MKITELPEECISLIVSLTSPRDACRLSLVCRVFKSASESDFVWNKFLPSDYKNFVSQSQSLQFPPLLLNSIPKKALYFHLCDNPIIIANDNMSFSLDKPSGKKCFMIGARGLNIAWGDTPTYWIWDFLPESRFPQVAKLNGVWWLHVIANVETRMLSRETTYVAYLVYKLNQKAQPFARKPVTLFVHFEGQEDQQVLSVYLNHARAKREGIRPLPRSRGDGWMEIEMGEFYTARGDDGSVSCNLREVSSPWSGLIVEGIEIRPQAAM